MSPEAGLDRERAKWRYNHDDKLEEEQYRSRKEMPSLLSIHRSVPALPHQYHRMRTREL